MRPGQIFLPFVNGEYDTVALWVSDPGGFPDHGPLPDPKPSRMGNASAANLLRPMVF